MLPENRKSTVAVPGRFSWPDSEHTSRLIDFEMGGLAVNDPSKGLKVQRWTLSYRSNTDVVLTPQSGDETVLFSTSGILELSLAFDQNMRPHVAYYKDGENFLWWWDSVADGMVTTNFGAGRSPRLAMDDKRGSQLSNSDIIFAYIRSNALYYRQQRDRFQTERLLRDGLTTTTRLRNIGMSQNWRMQFELA
jgi:hypothetical protein